MSSFKSTIASLRVSPSSIKDRKDAVPASLQLDGVAPISPPSSINVPSDDGLETAVEPSRQATEDWNGNYVFAPIKASQCEGIVG
jgi:hypothetical protein